MRRALWLVHLFATLITIGMVWGELLKSRGGPASSRPVVGEAVPWGINLVAVILLGLIWYTSCLLQNSPIRRSILIGIHLGWVVVFTWYGWFSAASPFRLHELRMPGLFNGADPSGAIAKYYAGTSAIYICLVALYSGIPLLSSIFANARRSPLGTPRDKSEARILAASLCLLLIALLDVAVNWMTPLLGWESAQIARTVILFCALILICVLAGRGSLKGLAFGLAEVAVIPAVWLLH